MSLEAETIGDAEGLESLRPAWRELWQRVRTGSVFQSPDWLIPWWRHFGPGRLLCIAVRRGKDLVGFAPLYQEEDSRRLLPVGISLSDYLDVLIADESADSVAEMMEAEISRLSDGANICFPDV